MTLEELAEKMNNSSDEVNQAKAVLLKTDIWAQLDKHKKDCLARNMSAKAILEAQIAFFYAHLFNPSASMPFESALSFTKFLVDLSEKVVTDIAVRAIKYNVTDGEKK